MKKRIVLTILLFFFGVLLICGAEETLAGSRLRVHGNIAPAAGITFCDGSITFLAGTKWSALINHSFLLGCGFYGVPFAVETASGPIRIFYGGPVLGWVFFSDKIVHFSVECMAGTGGTWYRDDPAENTPFWFLIPGGSVELNVTEHFHIALAGGYRFALNTRDAWGVVGELRLQFGDF